MKTVLVTGCAGFIGSHLCERLLSEGYKVVGVDNFNDYYNPSIKEQNMKLLGGSRDFILFREDICDVDELQKIFSHSKPDFVIHLAARAGVRASLEDPELYTQVNVGGTVNLLYLSTVHSVKKFIFGSSSSVYGNSKELPFTEDDICDCLYSIYGASKRSAEFFIESFYKNFKLPSVILRFFTVYGPRGREDMAPAKFTRAVINGDTIVKFGKGDSSRDYTYVDDIIDGIMLALQKDLEFEIINLGNNNPVTLNDFINTIEDLVGKKAITESSSLQIGDVEKTWANISKAKRLLGWEPKTAITSGLSYYIQWLNNRKT